ncbi:hypothetical protein ACQZV8_10895, partial [Magnetococcales bacterium HHB-1]
MFDLKMGAKLGGSFAFVGALFLIVIALYHFTLEDVQEQYKRMISLLEQKKGLALDIDRYTTLARINEKAFLHTRDLSKAEMVDKYINQAISAGEKLKAMEIEAEDPEEADHAQRIIDALKINQNAFSNVVSAWKVKGLTPKKGLQGEFRKAAHTLEKRLYDFDTAQLRIYLGELRRNEKDYVVRGKVKYLKKLKGNVDNFFEKLSGSRINDDLRTALGDALSDY